MLAVKSTRISSLSKLLSEVIYLAVTVNFTLMCFGSITGYENWYTNTHPYYELLLSISSIKHIQAQNNGPDSYRFAPVN